MMKKTVVIEKKIDFFLNGQKKLDLITFLVCFLSKNRQKSAHCTLFLHTAQIFKQCLINI